jgi:carboxymethylenebutenolidase
MEFQHVREGADPDAPETDLMSPNIGGREAARQASDRAAGIGIRAAAVTGCRAIRRCVLPAALILVAAVLSPALLGRARAADLPERVTFLAADGKTDLIGYLFKPAEMPRPRVPAVVMMHGRAGAYSSAAGGVYDSSTLSRRHRMWGELWAEAGYIALLVDGFGPRGHPGGFPRFSYGKRPPELNEVTVRPLDAYGALAYLRSRADVMPDRIGLMGWSNGASATLAAMSVDAPAIKAPTRETGFRVALAFYAGCGLRGRFEDGYRPYAPVRVFHGADDEEVSARLCDALVERSRRLGGDITIRIYAGATHGFDDPGRKRRRVAANAAAFADAVKRAQRFFARELEGKSW